MKFIKGITFAPFYRKNTLNTEQARESFDYMIENTGADFVILAPGGLQDTAHSEEICYSSNATFSDEELADMICYAKKKGVKMGKLVFVLHKISDALCGDCTKRRMRYVNRRV